MGRFDTAMTAVLAIAASGAAGTYAYNSFWRPPAAANVSSQPTRVKDWDRVQSVGKKLAGSEQAPVEMVVFGDLECPACRGFHTGTLQEIISTRAAEVKVSFAHFPLSYHKFAMPGARATECIENSDKLESWLTAVYQQQDSLGLKNWGAFARETGAADSVGMEACVRSKKEFPLITQGVETGKDAPIKGTPAVVINGWLWSTPPTMAQVDSIIQDGKRGK